MQRANADAVTRQKDGPLVEIDERQRELSLELGEHVLAVLLVEVHDDLGVGVGAENVALGFELGLALGVVEQLAVVDDGDGAVLVEDRLAAVAEADDAQSARCEAKAWANERAFLIGSAMEQRVGHALERGRIGLPLARQVDYSCNPAHRPSSGRSTNCH